MIGFPIMDRTDVTDYIFILQDTTLTLTNDNNIDNNNDNDNKIIDREPVMMMMIMMIIMRWLLIGNQFSTSGWWCHGSLYGQAMGNKGISNHVMFALHEEGILLPLPP